MNTLKTIWNFFFGFKGRLNRFHYLAFLVLYMYLFRQIIQSFPKALPIHTIYSTKEWLAYFFLTWFKYSHLVRRTKDTQEDTWGMGISGIAIFGNIMWDIELFFGSRNPESIIYGLSEILGLIGCAFSWLMFIANDHQHYHNEFGPPEISSSQKKVMYPFWLSITTIFSLLWYFDII